MFTKFQVVYFYWYSYKYDIGFWSGWSYSIILVASSSYNKFTHEVHTRLKHGNIKIQQTKCLWRAPSTRPCRAPFHININLLQILVLRVVLKILIYNTTPNSTCTWGTYLVNNNKLCNTWNTRFRNQFLFWKFLWALKLKEQEYIGTQ